MTGDDRDRPPADRPPADQAPADAHGMSGGDDAATTPQDCVTAGEDRLGLQRRSRLLLRAYPAAYRRDRGEEIIGTLLEATPEGRRWPQARDARALIAGGVRARAAQNRRRTTAANVRISVLLGAAAFLWMSVAGYLSVSVQYWRLAGIPGLSQTAGPPVLLALLLMTTTLLAWWVTPRIAVRACALAAATAIVFFVALNAHLMGQAVVEVMCVVALGVFARRSERPGAFWLLLAGLFGAVTFTPRVLIGTAWLQPVERVLPPALVVFVILASIAWIAVDARPVIAVATYFALVMLESAVTNAAAGQGLYLPFPFVLIVAVVAASALWLLRRQSAPKSG
jgi:hypothetical protein